MQIPPGLIESQQLPEPLFTPSTKALPGHHDENIHPDQGHIFSGRSYLIPDVPLDPTAAKLIGPELCAQISSISLKLYAEASQHAESRGLILADTKFEFGLISEGPFTACVATDSQTGSYTTNETPTSTSRRLLLIDELLTPDSSRYWPKDGYSAGVPQPSFDKQYLRDWLKNAGFRKGLENGPAGKEGEGWVMDDTVVEGTWRRYKEAAGKLMDQ